MVTPVSTVMGPTDIPFDPDGMVYDAEAVVLELDSDFDPDVIDVDPKALQTLVVGAFKDAMSGVVRDVAASTFARLRGRVD